MVKQKIFISSTIVVLIIGLLYLSTCGKSKERETRGRGKIKTNPFKGSREMIKEGEAIFSDYCEVCHGEGGVGNICPNLTDKEWRYGSSDNDLFTSISEGRPEGMPIWGDFLGETNIWKVITYIRSTQGNRT